MSRRRFEMFQYRQVLVRLRAGDSKRDIARAGLMGREKVAKVRTVAVQQGWLHPGCELPDDAAVAAAMAAPRVASSSVSSAEPWRPLVAQWLDAGVRARRSTPRCAACTATPAVIRRCTA